MLGMKTLRIAIAAMGLALLLGPGVASAKDINLDAEEAKDRTPVQIAAETIPAAATGATVRDVNIGSIELVITPGYLNALGSYYLRVALGGGALFKSHPDAEIVNKDGVSKSTIVDVKDGAGDGVAVYLLDETVELGDGIQVVLKDMSLSLPSAALATYTASMTVHTEQFDAIDNVGAILSISASGISFLRVVSGIDAEVNKGAPAVADVAEGFLMFVGGTPTATLGSAMADAKITAGVLDATDGKVVEGKDLIAKKGVSIKVEGDLGIGAFTLADDDKCEGAKVKGSKIEPNSAEVKNLDAGKTYTLCVDVDVDDPKTADVVETNSTPIPAGSYTGTIYTKAEEDAKESVMAATGPIGVIERNGTSVHLTYLTVSDKYNQRLIIVNRGSRSATYDLGDFASEEGTTVELSAGAMAAKVVGANVIPENSQVVLKVADLLSFTGPRARTSAALSIDADKGDIQVATTQVNLSDGSTDTVIYASEGGVSVSAASLQ